MTKIELQIQIAERLEKHKLEARCFFALCLIADMNNKGKVVTRSELKGRIPCDCYFLVKRLLQKNLVRVVPITQNIPGVHGSCVEQYFLTAKAIKLLKAVLE